MIRRSTLCLLLFVSQACISIGPPSPVKWGSVPLESITRTHLENASNAAASVTFDLGEMKISADNFEMALTRHVRIQINSEAGQKYANIRIPFWHDEKISEIRAQTILPDGRVIKLRREHIYEEGEKKGWRYKVFAIPGVQTNCVIEYQYRHLSKHLSTIDPWFFQRDIPTSLSRISVEIHEGFSYDAFVRNSPDPYCLPSKERLKQPGDADHWRYTWEFRDLPAIRTEPFMATPNDYFAVLHFQLIEFKSTLVHNVFARTLGDMRNEFYQSYKPYLAVSRRVRKLSQQILGGAVSGTLATEQLYDFVRDSVVTSEYDGYVGSRIRSPDEVIKEKLGSRVEKNLLLVSLLRAAGVNAKPVIISTRSHGKIDRAACRTDAFNHVLTSVDQGLGDMLFLDTAHPYCPNGLLPPNDLTNQGLVIDEGRPRYVNIPRPRTVSMFHARTMRAEIDAEGRLKASTMLRFDGYRNLIYRDKLADHTDAEKFIRAAILEDIENAAVDTFSIFTGDMKAIPLTVNLSFTVENFAEVIGEKIYFSPALFHKHMANIFQAENRSYPIEYPFPYMNTEEVVYQLPENYRIQELPKWNSFSVDGQEYERLIYRADNTLHYARQHRVKDIYYPASNYQHLKDFYTRMVDSDRDLVVLARVH
ncbi:MAG: DUF3857 domain-containing transglutaminase family protein [Fidelibacterota bacterium]|nr:MAG: DUF3857 domain-containing transglutaminase family protein [Candidatus Neomarinimicrobiota bacterium]